MQGFRLPAISDVEKCNVDKGQLLCKVSDLQLSLMSRKPNFDVKIIKVSEI